MNTKIRPELLGLVNEDTGIFEKFQNESLRPIIKMQHSLLISLFDDYQIKRKVDFSTLKKNKRQEFIEQNLKRDLKFKNLIIGIILGHFEEEEINFYINNKSELNKRITSIVIERLLSVYIK